jgi:signal transduction histidine kinase
VSVADPAVAPAAASPRPASDRGHLFTAAVLLLVPILLFLASLSFVMLLRRSGYPRGYGVLVDVGFLIQVLLIPVGIVAAVAVLVLRPRGRATSLRTRSFFVIAVAILIPSLCLSALGVWAYYRSWNTARVLYSDQAAYRAGELSSEIAGLSKAPGHFSPTIRALLTRAIANQYGAFGHTEGANWSTLAAVRDQHVLPAWAVKRLRRRGFAIGGTKGPTSPEGAEIVAWRVGPSTVRYYTNVWGTSEGFSAPVPVHRLLPIALLGIALIAILGLLGAWVLSRSVVRPVRRLAAASGRLAEGEAGVIVTPEGPRELRELAVSFNDMNAKLTKAQETEQAFLLSVSHELKTPLTSIRGYAEGIGDGTVKPDDGAEVIGAESSRLERLVGDLLESGRMRRSAFTVRREPVDLATVAEDVVRRYEATARDAGLTLLVSAGAGGIVLADHDRILQVVSNLVENAIRCTPAPGTVTITTAPAAITVADTGRGLTSDDLPHAFERFYLYSRYGTDRPVGTGLGLAIVKELTEAMGGTVSASSVVGVGTAFTVTLPANDSAAAPDQQVAAMVAPTATAVAPVASGALTAAPSDAVAARSADPAAGHLAVPAETATTAGATATAVRPAISPGPDPTAPAAPQDDAS